ncbi:DUF4244 domain-containing protein [Streptomyces ficellus]|uniref:DUF4244 domain-containing protein n=2 Tax=Streptomyces ficellus TaxID=1977088 RepID=A0A6I6FM40_9ACTN|nr:DUF4244 domain-containing protein [Streptomyces ficellus]
MVQAVKARVAWVARAARVRGVGGGRDAGMTTAEYAMGTLAACAFAAVLYKIVTSDVVSGGLQSLIGRALDAQF